MDIGAVISDFATAERRLPEASLRVALDHWETARVPFLELLIRCADGTDRSKATQDALFFVIHLLGEQRDTEAFPPLCRLLEDGELSESILSDAITEHLCGVLISTYDGDPSPLKKVIESATADEFARAAVLKVMAYLTRTGALTDEEMRAYLLYLRAEMQPRADSIVWDAWAGSAANLGYQDLAAEVEALVRDGLIADYGINLDEFNERLRRTLDDPNGMVGFLHDKIGPFTDTIGTLSTWYYFLHEFELAEERLAESRRLNEPYINPLRHVGRNDPCPCGSGKKYKKCCLQ